MHNITYPKILGLLHNIDVQYYRLIMLVGENQGKDILIKMLSHAYSIQVIDMSNELSHHLLEMSAKQRIARIDGRFNAIVEHCISSENTIIIIDNIEILFDVALQQNPLRLLQNISRKVKIIVFWSGKYIDNKLYYGDSHHPESRCYEIQDTAIIPF